MRLLLLVLDAIVMASAVSYRGYKLLRISPISDAALNYLSQFEASSRHGTPAQFDVWSWNSNGSEDSSADVLVSPRHTARLIERMRVLGATKFTVLQDYLHRAIEREKRQMRQWRRRRRDAPNEEDDLAGFDLRYFNTYPEISDYMTVLAKTFPASVQLFNITKTFEGRDMLGLKIANPSSSRSTAKPVVFIDAGLHAREWIAPAAALYLIDGLALAASNESRNGSSSNQSYGDHLRHLLDTFDFIIVPVANPDGYSYSTTKDRFWRKTRSRSSPRQRCVGADANRNWGYRWSEVANLSPCSSIFSGSHAFSEPEIAGLRDFTRQLARNITVYISLHAYGQVLLSPWGWTSEKPDNHVNQELAARRAIAAIQNATGANYHYGTISQLMYPASGTSLDYMHHAGVPYVYGMELRPADISEGVLGFLAPAEYIEPSGIELIASLRGIADHIHDESIGNAL